MPWGKNFLLSYLPGSFSDFSKLRHQQEISTAPQINHKKRPFFFGYVFDLNECGMN